MDERIVEFALTFAIISVLLFSPWLATEVIWSLYSEKLTESVSSQWLNSNYTSFSQTFVSSDFVPFGRWIIMNERLCFGNGSVLVWNDYYYIDPFGNILFLCNSTKEN